MWTIIKNNLWFLLFLLKFALFCCLFGTVITSGIYFYQQNPCTCWSFFKSFLGYSKVGAFICLFLILFKLLFECPCPPQEPEPEPEGRQYEQQQNPIIQPLIAGASYNINNNNGSSSEEIICTSSSSDDEQISSSSLQSHSSSEGDEGCSTNSDHYHQQMTNLVELVDKSTNTVEDYCMCNEEEEEENLFQPRLQNPQTVSNCGYILTLLSIAFIGHLFFTRYNGPRAASAAVTPSPNCFSPRSQLCYRCRHPTCKKQ